MKVKYKLNRPGWTEIEVSEDDTERGHCKVLSFLAAHDYNISSYNKHEKKKTFIITAIRQEY